MQPYNFKRPIDKIELEDREAKGLWKAIPYAKEFGERHEKIDLGIIIKLNEIIFSEIVPESAGKFRTTDQDIEPLMCIVPPPGSKVYGKMIEFEKELKRRLNSIGIFRDKMRGKKYTKYVDSVIDLAAWAHHGLVAIHPFSDGNGRTARLITNVILCHYNFKPTSVKIEAEDKDKYLNALCQIDKTLDYKPLKNLILRGSIETLKEEIKRKNNSILLK